MKRMREENDSNPNGTYEDIIGDSLESIHVTERLGG
jgi:hypothetical protein